MASPLLIVGTTLGAMLAFASGRTSDNTSSGPTKVKQATTRAPLGAQQLKAPPKLKPFKKPGDGTGKPVHVLAPEMPAKPHPADDPYGNFFGDAAQLAGDIPVVGWAGQAVFTLAQTFEEHMPVTDLPTAQDFNDHPGSGFHSMHSGVDTRGYKNVIG